MEDETFEDWGRASQLTGRLKATSCGLHVSRMAMAA